RRDIHSFPTRRSSDLGKVPRSHRENLFQEMVNRSVSSVKMSHSRPQQPRTKRGVLTQQAFRKRSPTARLVSQRHKFKGTHLKVRSEEHTSELQSQSNL